ATAFHRLSGSRTESLDDPSCAELPDPADIPAEQEKADEVHRLMRSIRALGELDSTIVLARYYYGLSSGEIGRMTGLSPSAARMRLRRALLKLKRELTKEEFL
ncbi:MAG: sigma-70 family RNA polymerase sigma factor, partial [Oscillospiraceae bacterium]|nr:sigma-70 family RNA polymerase sigma factor [Oscillospiraceae bacterium]